MRTIFAPSLPVSASAGLLLVRIVVGFAFVFHGLPKMMDMTGWMGPDAFAPPWLQACAALAEFAGGIALIVGFLTRFAALALVIDMGVALAMVEIPRGIPFIGPGHTLEPALAYFVVSALLFLAGPGLFSADAALSMLPATRTREQPGASNRPIASH